VDRLAAVLSGKLDAANQVDAAGSTQTVSSIVTGERIVVGYRQNVYTGGRRPLE
jgi:hypothetical protein